MLLGIGADTGDERNWTEGVEVGVSWEKVDIYYAMTQKQFRAKVKERLNEVEF